MVERSREGVLGGPLLAAAKRVVPWILFGAMLMLVFSMYSTYKSDQAAWDAQQNKPTPSQLAAAAAAAGKKKTSAPVKPASTANSSGINTTSKVLIVSDVTLRKDPSTSADPIRDLKTGEKLILVGQAGAWYKVTDTSGVLGYVSASGNFTKIVDK
jgi:hypothetical protein